MNLLDYVFPKRCVVCKKAGSYLCENCFINLSFDVSNLCLVCNKPSYNSFTHPKCKSKYSIDGCFASLVFNKTAQKLIYNFKYKPFLTDVKESLGNLFYESIIQNENFNKLMADGEWLMVPIPLSNAKLKKRGYNQSEILAKELSNKFGFPVKNLLKKVKDTNTQVGKSNTERKLNIKNAFELLNLKSSILGQNIFLVDDVVTTGSTLKEAANILKRNGVKRVIGLALARD